MLKNWLIDFICKNIQAGGWCGLCGKWIDYQLFPVGFAYGICDECRNPTKRAVDPPSAPENGKPLPPMKNQEFLRPHKTAGN